MTKETDIIIRHGALDESPLRGGTIILRGVLDPETLRHLKIDEYQREAAPLSSLAKLIEAFKSGNMIPDIDLGVRSQKFTSKEDFYRIPDDVYIIDGLQRVSAALHLLSRMPGATIRLGATVHFDTNVEWETERFRILNTKRSPVSPNVLLRNETTKSPALYTLLQLSTMEEAFPLYKRVSWRQRMQRGELISALVLAKTCGRLHAHKGPGRSAGIDGLSNGLEKIAGLVGLSLMRENLTTFFNLIEECWGIKHIQYRETATHLRGTFLFILAQVLSDHMDFWQGEPQKRLQINVDLRRKIKAFALSDPQVQRLCGSGGRATHLLYLLLVEHINSGKRTGQLKPRNPVAFADQSGLRNNKPLEVTSSEAKLSM